MRVNDSIRFIPSQMRIYPDKLKKILTIGIPSGIQGFLFSFSNVIIQSSINSFGSEVMAGNTAAGNIEGFIFISMNSFHQSALTFTGQYMGAKRYNKLKKIMLTNLALVFSVGFGMGLIAFIFRYPLLGIYLPGEDAQISYGVNRMMIITLTYFTCGLMDVLTGSIRGLGNSFIPMVITVLGVCGIRIAWVYTVFAAFPYQQILYISYPISWVVSFFIQLGAYFIILNKITKKNLKIA